MLEFFAFIGLMLLVVLIWEIHRFAEHIMGFRKGIYFRLCTIQAVLERLEDLLKPAEQMAVTLELYEVVGGTLVRVQMVKQSIEETKKYKVVARDKAGNEAAIDGAAEISMTSDLADIVMNEDGTFDVAPKGPIGSAKLQLVADALIGEGREEILGEEDFEFVAGKAVSLAVVPV